MDILKNCPFCGSKPELISNNSGHQYWYTVSCTRLVKNEEGLGVFCPGHSSALQYKTPQGAATAWNERHNAEANQAE